MNRLKEQMIAHADPAQVAGRKASRARKRLSRCPRQGERPRGHRKAPPGARGREKGLAGTETPLPVPAAGRKAPLARKRHSRCPHGGKIKEKS